MIKLNFMDQENKSKEEQAASDLKDIYQKFENEQPDQAERSDRDRYTDDAAEQLKGSDADADRNTGKDDLPDPEDAAEQLKGSDADIDRPA
jgi:hypothetical protein